MKKLFDPQTPDLNDFLEEFIYELEYQLATTSVGNEDWDGGPLNQSLASLSGINEERLFEQGASLLEREYEKTIR